MPRNNEIKFSEYFNLPNQGLRSYFRHVEDGSSEVIRAPFARKSNPQRVLKEWISHLEPIRKDWPTLYDYEMDLAKKVGPLSVMKPLSERIADIDSYYDSVLLESEPLSELSLKCVLKEWSRCRGLRIRDQKLTWDKMKKSTNSGSPYFTKKKLVADKTLPCSVKSPQYQWLQGIEWKACSVLGWRGQEGGPKPENVKQRVVWMFPMSVNVQELQCYQPLIESAQRFNLVPAWVSLDLVDSEITAMFDSKSPKDLVVCTDFTAFDQHFNRQLQEAARYILNGVLTPTEESLQWLADVFPMKYEIPLAYDYGKVRHGQHGMGSGSGGTNADETLVHRALQYEAAINAGARLNPHSQCLGDDGVLTYPGITVDDVVHSYTAHGLEMNESKQYASTDDCTYLRRWHHERYRMKGVCVGVYSTCRALGKLMYQERYIDGEPGELGYTKLTALRQLSIIENVKYHPLRDQFAEFCMNRDKYRLGIDIPGFLDNIESIAQESIELMPDFLGYTRTLPGENKDALSPGGISEWWIVKYLKSKQ